MTNTLAGGNGLVRRDVLKGLGLAVGTLVVSLPQIGCAQASTPVDFGPFVAIDPSGEVTIVCPGSDMGQGIYDSLPRLVAEELDCDWQLVRVRQAYANPAFQNPIAKKQRTANSESIAGYYMMLRRTGAAARQMLLLAAAERWDVDIAQLETTLGVVSGAGNSAGYGELTEAASRFPIPEDPPLKSKDAFNLIGKPLVRKDLSTKVNGSAIFGIDVRMPGMLVAALKLAPHPACEITAFDAEAALASPGVVGATKVNGGVAILANSFWEAKSAADQVSIRYNQSPAGQIDDAEIEMRIWAALDSTEAMIFPDFDTTSVPPKMNPPNPAVVEQAFANAHSVETADFEVPYLAHAALEPLCCTAQLTAQGLTIIGPLQDPERARVIGAELAGLPIEKVTVEVTFIGGGFGRKWPVDFVAVAVQAALAANGRPVKTIWTREQDFAVDQFRPAFKARTSTAFDAEGKIAAMRSRIAGQSIWTYQQRPGIPGVADPSVAGLLIYDRYRFPNKYIDFVETDFGIPVGYWRSVTFSQNSFFAESAIDMAAIHAGADPYLYRRELLSGDERLTTVLDRAARMIEWDRAREPGTGVGIAITYTGNAFCAQAAEVTIEDGTLSIARIVSAFDCGTIVDPLNVEAQIEGGSIFGLQAALWGEVGFEGGQPVPQNFDSYRMPLLFEIPEIETALIESDQPPGGAGELGTPGVAPAICNAIAAAGGARPKRLPLSRDWTIA